MTRAVHRPGIMLNLSCSLPLLLLYRQDSVYSLSLDTRLNPATYPFLSLPLTCTNPLILAPFEPLPKAQR